MGNILRVTDRAHVKGNPRERMLAGVFSSVLIMPNMAQYGHMEGFQTVKIEQGSGPDSQELERVVSGLGKVDLKSLTPDQLAAIEGTLAALAAVHTMASSSQE